MDPPEVNVQLSARNLELGAVMAEVVVDVDGQQLVSAITRASAERLGLAEGQLVTVFIKATEVRLGVEENRPGSLWHHQLLGQRHGCRKLHLGGGRPNLLSGFGVPWEDRAGEACRRWPPEPRTHRGDR